MGYSYGRTASGRWALSCDSCGAVGGVRKRTCPHRTTYAEGASLPYCYPSALCAACYKTHKATLHVNCAAGAAASTAREVAKRAKLLAGDKEVRTAFGDWHAKVPAGLVGVGFAGLSTDSMVIGGPITDWRLLPSADYDPGTKHYLSDYPAASPWGGPDA